MSGQVPPIFWFLFWVGLSVGVISFGFFMAIIIHRGNMKALEVLRAYAEKGIEPPPAVPKCSPGRWVRPRLRKPDGKSARRPGTSPDYWSPPAWPAVLPGGV